MRYFHLIILLSLIHLNAYSKSVKSRKLRKSRKVTLYFIEKGTGKKLKRVEVKIKKKNYYSGRDGDSPNNPR